MDFVVQVKSRDELMKVLQAIKNVKGVIAAKRIYREKVKAEAAH
jgi:GTP pyrophosphokinase